MRRNNSVNPPGGSCLIEKRKRDSHTRDIIRSHNTAAFVRNFWILGISPAETNGTVARRGGAEKMVGSGGARPYGVAACQCGKQVSGVEGGMR